MSTFNLDGLPNLKRVPINVNKFRLGGKLIITHPIIAPINAVLLKMKLIDQNLKK